MAGLSDLPNEILLHILSFLNPPDLIPLQLVSRGFYNLARDDGFWRARCLEESTFLETLHRRRRLMGFPDRDTPHAARILHNGNGTGGSNNHGLGPNTVLDGNEDGNNNANDDDDDGERLPYTNTTIASSVLSTDETPERERVRIMANWDPCFPSERVSWYDEYVQRHGPVAVNWMQYAYDTERGTASAADHVEARGVALYYPDGEAGETVLAVSPLDDGSVAMWDVAGSKGKRGAIVARSRPGILFIDGPGADNSRRSKRIDSGVTECVSVDSRQHRAFFAVQSHLIEVDLRRLSVVECESFPWSITALSAASRTVPLTVGTSLGIHLHDYRSRKPPRNDQNEIIDGFDRMGANEFYARSLRHIFDDEPLPPYAPLSQPGPLSILHLQQPGQEADLSDDIYVAGRFSNILHYDRRKFPSIRGSIHSGARLCSMTSLPYPFSTLDSELRRQAELSLEQVEASKSVAGGRTLIACGEYNSKGSLELYGLTPTASAHTGAVGGLQNSTLKNRQNSSQSKLMSVVNHGSRLAFSDGSGYIKWFERDGFTEVRRCRIGHSEQSQGPSIFASMPGSDDIARKLLPTRPAGEAGDDDNERGGSSGRGNNSNDLLFWTGEKLGLVTFSARPGFTAEGFEKERDEGEAPDAEALRAAQSDYSERMRRALERQADDVRLVRNLGLDSGIRPA
ncbi:hypothetical protein C8A01DRAFT_33718 [Parachaetomium inaequale]|uniref:F-box domain-containing protein n=1 Tax=Parachaetomium inaequale TaxID=2588326 RepID=A0AAN6PJV1_9PEZI|nr:hypothetical protein C8A01DRAFT_33718 [Parachaetomium inaequale]